MDKLPIEVLSNITSNLEEVSIHECMKVCRSWYSRMSQIYYQTLKYFSSVNALLRLTEMTRIDGKKIGDFARYIQFNRVDDVQLEDFCRLLQNLPYLHSIQFTNADKYVDFLSTIPPEHLQNVQEITACNCNKEVQKTLLSVRINLKNTITRMALYDLDTAIMVNGYSDLFSALAAFEKLKELHVYVNDVKNPLYLQQILSSCSHLEKLVFNSDRRLTLTEGNHAINRNLKKLTLNLLNGLRLEDMDYITDHLPSLKELVLDHIHQKHAFVFDLSVERPKKFVHYLKTLSKFKLKIYSEGDSTCSIQDERFWSYIQEVVNEDYSCNLDIAVKEFDDFGLITINSNAREKMIDIHNCWNLNIDLFKEPWTHSIQSLNLKAVNISLLKSSVDFSTRTLLLEPLIQVLKQRRNHHSTFLRVKTMSNGAIFTTTLRFVDPEVFEYRVQK